MRIDVETIFGPGPYRANAGYPEIAEAIERAITSATISAGDRLPTQRAVAEALGTAIGTVTRAYSEIERRGLIVGMVGRGTFVSDLVGRLAFEPAVSQGAGIIDLTVSRPPPEGAARYFANALRVLSKRRDLIELLGTEPPNGWLRHREAVTRWISKRGHPTEPNQVILCNGVQHALSVVFSALAGVGDIVASEELNYSGIRLLGDLHRVRLVGVPLDDEGLRPDKLEALCRAQPVRILLCSPTAHNPTTISMSLARRQSLVEIARRHDLLIVENDILGMMPVDPPPPIRALAPERTIYVTGLTKVTAAGMRLGFIAAAPSTLQPLMSGVRSTTWMPNPLTMEVFSLWLEDGSLAKIIAWHRAEIAARRELAEATLGGRIARSDPGTYHVWLPLPAPWTSDQFVAQAHDRGVFLSPSDTFALDAETAPSCARISLGYPNDRERLVRGLGIIGELLAELPEETESR